MFQFLRIRLRIMDEGYALRADAGYCHIHIVRSRFLNEL